MQLLDVILQGVIIYFDRILNRKKFCFMRIAILSLNPRHNYGGILQSYALKKVLEGMGHDVRVICKERHVPEFGIKQIIRWPYRLLRKLMGSKDTRIFIEHYYNKQNDRKYQNTDKFVDKYLNPRFVRSLREIKEWEFDAFVVGSDQVWRPQYFKTQFKAEMSDAYLSFTKGWDVKRIAYAASFGVDKWEYSEEETQRCAMLLSHFNSVSVREESGIRLCREYLGREDVICLCDPTILLTQEEYEEHITPDIPSYKGNLFVYCLDVNKKLDALVSRISKEKGLTPFSIDSKFYPNYSTDECVKASVESWIRAFNDAEFIITDSFHACVFSLIFHKPFVAIGNTDRGMARFESLLTVFRQTQRLLYSADDDFSDSIYLYVDGADETLSQLRSKSIVFLENGLSNKYS